MKQMPQPKPDEIELIPDAWERFGEFVKRIARAGPQHRPAKKDHEPSPARGGKRGGSKPA